MDPLGIQKAMAAAPAELQPLIQYLMDRTDALEAQAAKDTEAIADKVIAAVVPLGQAMVQTVNNVADEAMTLIRRFDGASMTVKLGPEPPAANSSTTVSS